MSDRSSLTPDQRALDLGHIIDPGFVNHRKVQTIQGPGLMRHIDRAISELPSLPDWQLRVRIDHIYSEAMILFCRHLGIKPLQDILATQTGQTGQLFCSTEQLLPCPAIYTEERALSVWKNPGSYPFRVEFHYSKRHIASDTLRSRLAEGSIISIIAQLYSATPTYLYLNRLSWDFLG